MQSVVCNAMIHHFKLIIISQLISLTVWGQLPNTKYFTSRNRLCSSTILLDSLGNFYKEGGCEGRSYISFGTYKLQGNRVDFTFQRFDSLPPIFQIKESTFSNDSIITVTFLTKQGNPLLSCHFSVDAIETSGKFFQTIGLNDKGQVKVNIKKYKELRLDYLEHIYNKKIRLPINNKDISIILSLPQLFFNYPRPRPKSGSRFSLLVREDGLYDLTGKVKEYSCNE